MSTGTGVRSLGPWTGRGSGIGTGTSRRCGEAHRDGGDEQDGDAASEQRLFP
jgi:hypothetical protein